MFESAAVIIGGVIVAVVGIALYTIKRLIIIVPPNSAAVITGRQRLLGDGTQIGYRTVTCGRIAACSRSASSARCCSQRAW